jgi:hypothetical protein
MTSLIDWESRAKADGWVRQGSWWVRRSLAQPGVTEETVSERIVEMYGGPRSAVARAAIERVNSSGDPVVHLRTLAAARPYAIRLNYGAHDAIRREAADIFHRMGGRVSETAGWLFTTGEAPRLTDVVICRASDPGPESKHGRDAVRVTRAELVRRELPDYLAHLRIVGCWHSHTSPDPKPSRTDLVSWALRLERLGDSRWPSVIATPAKIGGWENPDLNGWLTSPLPGRSGEYACEPADVVRLPL